MINPLSPEARRTVEQQMAIEVLRGDLSAAAALKDWLEEHFGEEYRALREAVTCPEGAYDGYAVYGWPEFRAFAKRLGIPYGARTVRLTITLAEGEAPTVVHEYQAADMEEPQAGASGGGAGFIHGVPG